MKAKKVANLPLCPVRLTCSPSSYPSAMKDNIKAHSQYLYSMRVKILASNCINFGKPGQKHSNPGKGAQKM